MIDQAGTAAASSDVNAKERVLEVDQLNIIYDTEDGPLHTVRDVSLNVRRGETLGLVGESGSGKSTLVMGAIGYLAANGRVSGGSVRLLGESITGLSQRQLADVWGVKVAVVHQNPLSALNPSIRIGKQIAEVARLHRDMDARQARDLAVQTLTEVAMPDPENILQRYPHQVSGGMLQRCVIAMALMTRPELLIMDEPTTALDVTTQAVVLDLIGALKKELDSAIVYITHDLGVVAKICDRVAVMYAGEILEESPLRDTFKASLHPYTRRLLGCVPQLDPTSVKQPLPAIPGRIPRVDELPEGCIFSPRCEYTQEQCEASRPQLAKVGADRWTACRRWSELPQWDGQRFRDIVNIAEAGAIRDGDRLVDAIDVAVHYSAVEGGLRLGRRDRRVVHALDDTTLWIGRGQTLGIVGESGSGKTTLARAIIGLSPATNGTVTLDGQELPRRLTDRKRPILKKIQMVFQNPDATLNPHRSVGAAVARPLRLLNGVRRQELRERSMALLKSVELPAHYYNRRPDELSQGERQRVAIARAFAADPDLVLCDEPISSLDVSVQGAIMNLLLDLQSQKGTSYLFISHDLSAVQHLADVVAVVYLGHMMEWGAAAMVLDPPFHPYTEALLSAVPVADPDVEQSNIRLQGSVPTPIDVPTGCRFHPRCPRCLGELCSTKEPPWQEGEGGHWVYCHIPLETLSEVQAPVIEASPTTKEV